MEESHPMFIGQDDGRKDNNLREQAEGNQGERIEIAYRGRPKFTHKIGRNVGRRYPERREQESGLGDTPGGADNPVTKGHDKMAVEEKAKNEPMMLKKPNTLGYFCFSISRKARPAPFSSISVCCCDNAAITAGLLSFI